MGLLVEVNLVPMSQDEKAVLRRRVGEVPPPGCKRLSFKPSPIPKVTSQGSFGIFHMALLKKRHFIYNAQNLLWFR